MTEPTDAAAPDGASATTPTPRMNETVNVVSVTRRIEAPPSQVFAILTDPAQHPEIDGSGMLRQARRPRRLSGVGDTFVIEMHNEEMGDYEMTSHVVSYEQDRLIVWEPVLTAASRDEDLSELGDSAHQRWGYSLVPDGADATIVTEFYDCSESPAWLKKAVRGGERWTEAMRASLERLEALSLPAQSA